MKKWISLCKKIFFPPLWLVCFMTVVCTIGLIYIFINGLEMTVIAYICYTFSAYTLTVVCLTLWKTIPVYYKQIKSKAYNNKYTNRYLTDVSFKTNVTLHRSLIINSIYVVTNAISGIVYHTYWFVIFAVYYAIMAGMWYLLMCYINKYEIGQNHLEELKCARRCVYILITINLTLSGIVLMMVYHNRGFNYQGMLIYMMALYTFYTTGTTIRDIVKYRKYNSPIMSISKIINLTAALFSMLFLETAMFAQFGNDTSLEVQKVMIMATGAGISMIVVIISVYMIIKTTAEINMLKEK